MTDEHNTLQGSTLREVSAETVTARFPRFSGPLQTTPAATVCRWPIY